MSFNKISWSEMKDFYLESYDCPPGHRCMITDAEKCAETLASGVAGKCYDTTVSIVKGVWKCQEGFFSRERICAMESTGEVFAAEKRTIFAEQILPRSATSRLIAGLVLGVLILGIAVLFKRMVVRVNAPHAAPPPPPAPAPIHIAPPAGPAEKQER